MENKQDFSKKMTIVVREDVASWQLTNTVGHIAAYLGNKMTETFDTGESFTSEDGLDYPRNSQYAVVTLKATEEQIKELAKNIRNTNLLWIVYVQEMIDMIDDAELADALKNKNSDGMNILGIGIFGPKDELKRLTAKMKLFS